MKSTITTLLLLLCTFLSAQSSDWHRVFDFGRWSSFCQQGRYFWFNGNSSLLRFDTTTGQTVYFDATNSPIGAQSIKRMGLDINGDLWINIEDSDRRTYRYINNNWDEVLSLHGLLVYCWISDQLTHYEWLGTSQGNLVFNRLIQEEPLCRPSNTVCYGGAGNSTGFWGIAGEELDLCSFIPDGDMARVLRRIPFDNPTRIKCFTTDNRNRTWMAWDYDSVTEEPCGIMYMDNSTYAITNIDIHSDCFPTGEAKWIGNLIFDENNDLVVKLYFSTEESITSGYYKYINHAWEEIHFELGDYAGTQLSRDSDNNYWFYHMADSGSSIVKYREGHYDVYNVWQNSSPTPPYYDCTTDDNGNLWLLSADNLQEYYNGDWYPLMTINSNHNNQATVISVMDKHNYWAAPRSGDPCYITRCINDSITTVAPHLYSRIVSFNHDAQKRLWFVTEQYLYYLDPYSTEVCRVDNSNYGLSEYQSVRPASDGNIWLGTLSDLRCYNNGSFSCYNSLNSPLANGQVFNLALSSSGNLWLGTDSGLYNKNGDIWQYYNTNNTIMTSDTVMTVFCVGDTGILLGTPECLYRSDGISWQVYDKHNSPVSFGLCREVLMDNCERMWVTDHQLNLFFYDPLWHNTPAEPEDTPTYTSLKLSNYPNPFNPSTTIKFNIPQAGRVELAVYNVRGQKVRTLVNDTRPQGVQTVVFNGHDDAGNTLASGVYLYRLEAVGKSITKKMLLLK